MVTKRWLVYVYLFLAAGLAVGLMACGGGGGGGETSTGNTTPFYTGPTDPASLSSALEGAQFAGAILVTAVQNDFVASFDVEGLALALQEANDLHLQISGEETGLVSVDLDLDENTGNLVEMQMHFNNYDDEIDGLHTPLDGALSFTISNWNSEGIPTQYMLSFSRLQNTDDKGQISEVDGTIKMDERVPNRVVSVSDYVIHDGMLDKWVWRQGLREETVLDFSVGGLPNSVTSISGTLYHSDYGRVSISTITPLVNNYGKTYPVEGVLSFIGERNSEARLTIQRLLPELLVELDATGDNVYEQSGRVSWEQAMETWSMAPRIVSAVFMGDVAGVGVRNEVLFWNDFSDAPIKRMEIGGNQPQGLAVRMYDGGMKAMTIDGNSIYWVQNHSSVFGWALYKSSRDGTRTEVLLVDEGSDFGDAYGTSMLAADGRYVYFGSYTTWPLQSTIRKVPVAGGPPEIVVTTGNELGGMASDGLYFYWVESPLTDGEGKARIYRKPVTGGAAELIISGFTRSSSYPLNHAFSVDGDDLFFTDSDLQTGLNMIRKVPVAGGQVANVMELQEPPRYLAADSDRVAVMTDGFVYSAPRAGGALTLLASIGPGNYPVDLACQDGIVYWIEKNNLIEGGTLKTRAAAGGSEQIVMQGLSDPVAMSLSGSFAYVAENNYEGMEFDLGVVGRLSRVSLAGGTLKVLVSGLSAGYITGDYVFPFVIDQAGIFVLDRRSLKKFPLTGGTPMVLDYVSTFSSKDSSISTDGSYVYYFNGIDALRKVSVNGGSPSTLATVQLVGPLTSPLIRQAGNYVYWWDGNTVWSVALNSLVIRPVIIAVDRITDFQVDTTHIYLAEDSRISRMSLTGGGRAVLAEMDATHLALEGAHIYWLDSTGRQIGRLPKNGGSPQIFYDSWAEQSVAQRGPIIDNDYVYWVSWDRDDVGTILRTPK